MNLVPNLFDSATRRHLTKLYGGVPALTIGHKKAALQGGSHEVTNDMASIPQNTQMEIPARKTHGSEWVKVTPEIATYWLGFNVSNRALTNAKLSQFGDDMAHGEWKDDGAPIRFAPGKLLDGQHRLTALVMAGVTLRLLVVFGLDPEVQVTMDTGRGRTPRDVLSIEGMNSWESRTFGAAVHGVMSAESGALPSNVKRFTNREVRNYYLENQPAADASLRMLREVPRKPTLLPFSRALTLHILFSKHSRDDADNFFRRLYVGDGLNKTSPIFHLRQRLLNDLVSKNHRSAFSECFYLIKAWNAFRAGGAWKGLNPLYPRDGEQMPEIK